MENQLAIESAPPPDGDLLFGVPKIADFLGVTERQARHQCESGRLPTFKMGQIICSRRSTLWRWLAEQEAAAEKTADDDGGHD